MSSGLAKAAQCVALCDVICYSCVSDLLVEFLPPLAGTMEDAGKTAFKHPIKQHNQMEETNTKLLFSNFLHVFNHNPET